MSGGGGGMGAVVSGMTDPNNALVSRGSLNSILDEWYAKKQPLQQSTAAPNSAVYTPNYGQTTQQPTTQTQQAPMPQQRQDYGWRPMPMMGYGGYGMQTPFSIGGYGMQAPFSMGGYGMGYGGYGGGYGGYGGYSPFGGGFGYGQMYNPFSMY